MTTRRSLSGLSRILNALRFAGYNRGCDGAVRQSRQQSTCFSTVRTTRRRELSPSLTTRHSTDDPLTFNLPVGEIAGAKYHRADGQRSRFDGHQRQILFRLDRKRHWISFNYLSGAISRTGSLWRTSRWCREFQAASPRWGNFDASIRPDGNRLYFVDGFFNASANFPQSAVITIAKREGDHFVQRLTRTAKPSCTRSTLAGSTMRRVPPHPIWKFSSPGSQIPITGPRSTPRDVRRSRSHFEPRSRSPRLPDSSKPRPSQPTANRLYYHKNRRNGVFVIYRVTRP